MESIAEKASKDLSKTKKELMERWEGSPELIAEDLFRVRSLETGEVVPLETFDPYQPQLVNAYFYGDEKIINVYKGRRIGVSFIFSVCILIDGLVNPESSFPVVSRTKDQSENRIKDIERLIKHARIDIGVQKSNIGEIVLENGTSFQAYSGNPNSSRGDDAAKTVFVDEMAFLEDQKGAMRSFMPFISLGGQSKMLQVSTPNMANDIFLQNHERGSEGGENGIISIKIPTFKEADQIDINESLTEQGVEPVRPDLDIKSVETERAQDPKGFAQEYLCRPLAEEYRFFDEETIKAAQERSLTDEYRYGTGYNPPRDATVVMGVDIGISSDDTALAVFEHRGNRRNLRYTEIITDKVLSRAGIFPAKRRNPSSVASRLAKVKRQFGVDYVVLDKTGPGEGFQSEIEQSIGRGAHPFNFSDKDAVAEMMGDFNYGLHNDLITLLDKDRIYNELSAIVKKQSHEYQKPKFTGKDHSESGKDDLAIAMVLAAYPPNIDTNSSKRLHEQDETSDVKADPSSSVSGSSGYSGAKTASSRSGLSDENSYRRDSKKTYKRRHSR
jgi:hypothetical protein